MSVSDLGWFRAQTAPVLRVSYFKHGFEFVVANRSEVEVIKEMLVNEQYAGADLNSPRLILDLGSNIGASIAFFHARYPQARIIGLEPDPSTFARLAQSVGHLPLVEIYPWAVADLSGRLPFQPARQSWASALAGDPDGGSIEVQALSLRDLLRRLDVARVDLLKVDVEGAEWRLFEDPASLAACDTVVGELHLDGPGETKARALQALSGFEVTLGARTAVRVNFVAHRRGSG